jgi:predicted LPLAT superfamily acyltransferase/GT2 family glycosyltransferase
MSFRPCFVVPLYNHGNTLAGTVAKLAVHGLPIVIVDDGSDHATQDALAAVAAAQPLVQPVRLPVNQGKGAAVVRGFREAQARGHTHALQIDADGQHDANDVPAFLERGRRHPEALILGTPVFDDTISNTRYYGRYLTHVWVWIETLSFAIRDSMCGFRLYPLAATLAILDEIGIPARMAFDTEIAVRLVWAGTPVENIPTRVTYPPGGTSHFRMVRDNVGISWMHTRLVCGMLLRLPVLLGRKLFGGADTGAHWANLAERGSTWGLQLTAATYRLLGRRATQVLLLPVVGYFFLTGRRARHASRDYFERLHAASGGATPVPGLGTSFRHMQAFGASNLDKLAAWHGDVPYEAIDFPDKAAYERLAESGCGALLLSAHVGNLEMMRALAHVRGLHQVNAVVYTEHAMRFNRVLAAANPGFPVNLIHLPTIGPDTAIHLKDKVERGELLVIVGDRTSPSDNGRVVNVDFLGGRAALPQGPYILAHLMGCPVYLFFCLAEGGRYRLRFELFAERIELPRQGREERIAHYAQAYARQLESCCLSAPDQWFNFFDFWRPPASPA